MPLLLPVSDCLNFLGCYGKLVEDDLKETRSLFGITVEICIKLRNVMKD